MSGGVLGPLADRLQDDLRRFPDAVIKVAKQDDGLWTRGGRATSWARKLAYKPSGNEATGPDNVPTTVGSANDEQSRNSHRPEAATPSGQSIDCLVAMADEDVA